MIIKKLDNICSGILERVKDRKRKIDEERVQSLFEGIVENLTSDLLKDAPDSCRNLYSKINELWYYKKFQGYSAEEIFLLGGIWGAFELVKQKEEVKKRIKDQEELVKRYERYAGLFKAVFQSPGINHKELADKTEKSVSELSQIMNRMTSEKLFTFNRAGREKHYYLSEKGKLIYEKLKIKKKEIGKKFAFYETNNIFNISEKTLERVYQNSKNVQNSAYLYVWEIDDQNNHQSDELEEEKIWEILQDKNNSYVS